jgi:hypothetical protein
MRAGSEIKAAQSFVERMVRDRRRGFQLVPYPNRVACMRMVDGNWGKQH